MYWNNPIVEIRHTADPDPIVQAQHHGNHALFYNPAQAVNEIIRIDLLQEWCDMANTRRQEDGDNFAQESRNSYLAANLVRINLYVESLRQHGSIKPMLLYYSGQLPFEAATGGTRLMASELLPNFTHVTAFITTHQDYANQFSHLQRINTFEEFRQCCGVELGTQFWFRLTDTQAPWGLDWYEVSVQVPGVSVPGDQWCLSAIKNYLDQQPADFQFDCEWFGVTRDWSQYAEKLPD